MTWLKCPECGATVSDEAIMCPKCNCPVGESIPLPEENTSLSPSRLLAEKIASSCLMNKKIGFVSATIIIVAACIMLLLAFLEIGWG